MTPVGMRLHEFIEDMVEQGLPLPYLIVAIGINGSFAVSRYQPPDVKELGSFGKDMHFPVNYFVVGADGNASRCVMMGEDDALMAIDPESMARA
jgi:hypothetical protein